MRLRTRNNQKDNKHTQNHSNNGKRTDKDASFGRSCRRAAFGRPSCGFPSDAQNDERSEELRLSRN